MSVLTEIQDLEAVVAYARSLPCTGDELLLMGGSQGGFVSALTAAKPEHKVNKLLSSAESPLIMAIMISS